MSSFSAVYGIKAMKEVKVNHNNEVPIKKTGHEFDEPMKLVTFVGLFVYYLAELHPNSLNFSSKLCLSPTYNNTFWWPKFKDQGHAKVKMYVNWALTLEIIEIERPNWFHVVAVSTS